MKIIAIIPARYSSTRLPGKLIKPLGDTTVINATYQAVCNTQLFDDVYVVTDHEDIYKEIKNHDGNVVYSNGEFECGTDRIASVLPHLPDAEIYVNVQGDEPFTTKAPLQQIIEAFKADRQEKIGVITLKQKITDEAQINNPNVVKIITRADDTAIYFSRSPIPYKRESNSQIDYYKHIGIYAFRKNALIAFASLPIGPLEHTEKLENLRFIENNITVKALSTDYINFGIDTQEDLDKANAYLNAT
jgi:3-deoxy-manno-octulosonate cytidylyltransferase (CMP-KDO synthetase)